MSPIVEDLSMRTCNRRQEDSLVKRSKKVTFGVRIPVEGWVPISTQSPDFTYFIRLAQTAERLGYGFVLVADHLLNWIGSTPKKAAPAQCLALGTYESWTTLSALAAVTEKIKLSNIVLCNLFRAPSLLAKMASTLDIISGGRLVLSMGAGWLREECRRYGLDWFPYEERIERLRESVQVIKKLWTEKRTDFLGKHYRLENAMLEPKPTTKSHPPIWLGGASDSIMRIVAEEGDGWDLGLAGSPEAVKARIDRMNEYCDKISRRADSIKLSHSCIVVLSDTKDCAVDLVKAKARDLNTTPEFFMERHLVGSPNQIASRMNEYVDTGVRHFTLYFDRDLRNLDPIASEVIPQVG